MSPFDLLIINMTYQDRGQLEKIKNKKIKLLSRAVCHIVYRQTKRRKVKENNSGNGKNFHLLPSPICHINYDRRKGRNAKENNN